MFTELNEKLLKAQEGISRLQKINAILNDLESEKSRLEQKSHELQSILNKENEDVKKIENQSIASFFYSVLGSLPERIDKERKEALAAKLKYDQ
jgi:hypothetical protein